MMMLETVVYSGLFESRKKPKYEYRFKCNVRSRLYGTNDIMFCGRSGTDVLKANEATDVPVYLLGS